MDPNRPEARWSTETRRYPATAAGSLGAALVDVRGPGRGTADRRPRPARRSPARQPSAAPAGRPAAERWTRAGPAPRQAVPVVATSAVCSPPRSSCC